VIPLVPLRSTHSPPAPRPVIQAFGKEVVLLAALAEEGRLEAKTMMKTMDMVGITSCNSLTAKLQELENWLVRTSEETPMYIRQRSTAYASIRVLPPYIV
jgi:hypothetical protein